MKRRQLTAAKARQILKAGRLHGKPITAAQRILLEMAMTDHRRPARRRRNPPEGRVMIGDEVEKIFYRKGQQHDCDEKCKAADHRFVHTFTSKFPLWGYEDGHLEI